MGTTSAQKWKTSWLYVVLPSQLQQICCQYYWCHIASALSDWLMLVILVYVISSCMKFHPFSPAGQFFGIPEKHISWKCWFLALPSATVSQWASKPRTPDSAAKRFKKMMWRGPVFSNGWVGSHGCKWLSDCCTKRAVFYNRLRFLTMLLLLLLLFKQFFMIFSICANLQEVNCKLITVFNAVTSHARWLTFNLRIVY